jgi:hypothetical protein
MTALLRKVFLYIFGPHRRCKYCGAVKDKEAMHKGYGGWFCTVDEAYEWWLGSAW